MIPHWGNYSLANIDGEAWIDMVGYEGRYMVSNKGRVKSLSRLIKRKRFSSNADFYKDGRIRVLSRDGQGYRAIELIKDRILYRLKIHRIVATHFIPNPENKRTVNHKDGNKLNNAVDNLEWATYSENLCHAFRTGLKKSSFQLFGAENPKSKPVNQLTRSGIFIKRFAGQADAERATNVDQASIWRACNGKQTHAGGFKWEYPEGFGLGEIGASIHTIKKTA
jgi:hypothetical protein